MRYLTDGQTRFVFFCDRCGKRLDDPDDRGDAYIEDLERFVDAVGTDHEEPAEYLCRTCLAAARAGSPA